MKITFILKHDSLAGGIRVVATYADKLKKRGHLVTVLSTPDESPSFKQKIKNLISGKPSSSSKKNPSYFDAIDIEHIIIDKCRPIVNEDVPDADAVIATWWETAEWVNTLQSSKGEKFYFIQGHEIFEWLPVERVKKTYLMPLKKITISQWLVDILKNEYGQTDVTLVPNSVDTDFFNAKEKARQKIPTVGFVYSTDNFKGCDITIEALNRAAKKMPHIRILSFGSHHESKELPLPQNAEFRYQPPQEEIPGIYASCDFWLFGSRNEGFGLPILEAMACGTPVIATAAGAGPEIISQGGGLLLNEKTPESMANAIIDCFNAPLEKWEKMSCFARKTAEAYTWDHAVLMLENALLSGKK